MCSYPAGVGRRLSTEDLTILERSAAMAPLGTSQVAQLIDSHRQVLADHAELTELLHRLAPPWQEVRSILNDIRRSVAEPDDHA